MGSARTGGEKSVSLARTGEEMFNWQLNSPNSNTLIQE